MRAGAAGAPRPRTGPTPRPARPAEPVPGGSKGFLPPFANAENRALDGQIKVRGQGRTGACAPQPRACAARCSGAPCRCRQRRTARSSAGAPHLPRKQELEAQLEAADISIEEHGGRITVMEEHLKNVRQEIAYTESRVRGCAARLRRAVFLVQPPASLQT